MTESNQEQASGGLTTSRIETLVDGVFAIAMTLLVLNLRVPLITHGNSATALPHKLLELWPNLLSYALSFVVLGVYWVGHHNQFHFIRRTDRTLLWINILFLTWIAFVPFTAALMAQYPDVPLAVAVYGANLVVVGLILWLQWWYATSQGRLVDDNFPPRAVRTGARRILLAPVVYVFAIAVSLLSTRLSIALYVLVPLAYILPSGIDRHWRQHRPLEAPESELAEGPQTSS